MKKNLLLSLFMAMTMMTLCPQSMMAQWTYNPKSNELYIDGSDVNLSVSCYSDDSLVIKNYSLGLTGTLDLTAPITDETGKSYFIGKIADNAFSMCGADDIILPKSVKYIGTDAFALVNNISELNLGDDVTIGEGAFQNCKGLTKITVGKNANICDNAFGACTALQTIKIGDNAILGPNSFAICKSMTELFIGANATIDEHAFTMPMLRNSVIYVPQSEVDKYLEIFSIVVQIIPSISIDEASTEVPYWENGEYAVSLERSMVKGKWNTFNVPFDIDADEVAQYFGEGTKIKRLFNISSEGVVTLKDTTAIAAGYMYLVKNTADLPSPYTFSERAVYGENEIDTDEGDYTISVYDEAGESAAMAGFVCGEDSEYAVMSLYNDMNVNIMSLMFTPYILSGDKFYRVDSDVDLKGTRWFIGVMAGASAKKTLSVDFGDADDSEATGISAVNAPRQADGNCYNVLGQKVNANATGLVIVNGRKLLRK